MGIAEIWCGELGLGTWPGARQRGITWAAFRKRLRFQMEV